MNLAATKLSGVSSITISVIHAFFESMNMSVTIIVTIPENS